MNNYDLGGSTDGRCTMDLAGQAPRQNHSTGDSSLCTNITQSFPSKNRLYS